MEKNYKEGESQFAGDLERECVFFYDAISSDAWLIKSNKQKRSKDASKKVKIKTIDEM